MTAIVPPYVRPVPGYAVPPLIVVQFRMLRDGEVTAPRKELRFYRGLGTFDKLDLVFEAELGEFSRPLALDLATQLAQGEWLVIGHDDSPPRRVRAAYLALSEGLITFNIASGEGAAPGSPAQVTGIVRVERVPADREIVVLERPVDGEWRVAGHGPTPGGSGEIDVRVVGGDVYAVGLDAWGSTFVPLLAVILGQRIRPTTFAGWVYEITEPGVLPATEPDWWPAEGDNPSRPLGTARAVARRYYQPLAVGPIPVEV
ncbi:MULTISPECIES: hypothetical protein [unclassified Pseudomonas]|uniref:hypothetical protein n=1 Tax=unclassified Pseudomonas TaxID=196821 RepID=UPI0024495722|nr:MULTISPECIES: hypothetical protein [unclassified Pseudomonas]MDH0894218.1 hypothetical protein [Pseudomonas sp. GD03875]MDH1063487.1 hypothetical protein [Pseudomonas sp. GD03985]